MKQYIDTCIRHMTGIGSGTLHPELERFFQDQETRYRNCGMQAIPQEHMPLLMLVVEQRKIPLVAPPKPEKSPELKAKLSKPGLQAVGV